jgi:hypothetical protein
MFLVLQITNPILERYINNVKETYDTQIQMLYPQKRTSVYKQVKYSFHIINLWRISRYCINSKGTKLYKDGPNSDITIQSTKQFSFQECYTSPVATFIYKLRNIPRPKPYFIYKRKVHY